MTVYRRLITIPVNRKGFHRQSGNPGFGVNKDDVEAAADGAAAFFAAGGDEAGAVAQLEEFHLGDGFDADPDEVGEDVMVLLKDADDLGVSAPPLPGFSVVVSVLAFATAELLIFPSIRERVAALQAICGSFIQFVLHGLIFFARENGCSGRLIQGS